MDTAIHHGTETAASMSVSPERAATNAKCQRCGYTWQPRIAAPKECPACKSRSWMAGRIMLAADNPELQSELRDQAANGMRTGQGGSSRGKIPLIRPHGYGKSQIQGGRFNDPDGYPKDRGWL